MHDAHAPNESGAHEPAALVDAAVVHEMAHGCGWTVAELATYYAPRARTELEEVRSAHANGDANALLRLAHGAAGSSSSIGASAMTALYLRIEQSTRDGDDTETATLLEGANEHLSRVLAALDELGATT